MIDNFKEYIVCAAYKTNKDTPYLKYLTHRGFDLNNVYYEPHRQVMGIITGWRHSDILLKFGDFIDKEDGGGFMTSKCRYVNRIEAMKIALEAGQVTKEKAIREDGKNGGYCPLFSEDIYESMKEMFKGLLEKLCCKHKLDLYDKVCSKRGKIKRIKI